MRKLSNTLAVLFCTVVVIAANSAHAGRSCEAKRLSVDSIDRGLSLAERTRIKLEDSGHKLVILARAGQDLSKYGLRYSHLGFAYRQPDGKGGHVWRVLHKLNHCGTAESAIYRQGLGEFFLDDLWRYEAAYVVPRKEVQERLHSMLLDDNLSLRYHHKPYNLVSYPWAQHYQQSNQWVLETMASAMESAVSSREQAQAWLKLHSFKPTTLQLGPLTRLGGRISAANVAFDDHPTEKRFSNRIETTTVDSVFAWLQRSQLGDIPIVIRMNQ